MLQWLRYPFVRFTPAFIAGIIFYEVLKNTGIGVPASLALVGFVLLLILISTSKKFFSLNPVAGGSSLIIFFLAGIVLSSSHYQLSSPNHFSRYPFTHYHGVVESWPEERENFYRFILNVDYVKDSKWKKAKGKIQVYYPKNEAHPVSYGSKLLLKKAPIEINGPRNPGEFNYKKYLARKNIFHQQFLKAGEYMHTGIQYPNRLKAYAGLLRNKADSVLSQYLDNSDRLSIARAMILGIRTDMDDEMRTAYANAGAMHILAISGLHVGIIYGFLALILAPLRNTRKGKYVFTVVILSILWSYALLVGMSPSVMRASVMFSLIAIGQAFYRTPDIFNTIAFSALLLLIINPFQLFEVGFQLSYLAVLGIVLIFRNVNSWVSSKYWIINKVWAITSVAIAAQLMTFPLALHYFHNFPNLFFFSNLIVIPAAFIILTSGILLLSTSVFSIDLLSDLLANALSFTLGIMNQGVSSIESIPYSHVSNVYLPGYLTIGLYLIIIGVIGVILMRKVDWFYFLFSISILFGVLMAVMTVMNHNNQLMAIYDISGTTVFDFVHNGKIKSNEPGDPPENHQYQVNNFRIKMAESTTAGNANYREVPAIGVKLFLEGGKSLVWVHQELNGSYESHSRLKVDYLLISDNSVSDFDHMIKLFDPGLVVLDSSNDYFYSIEATDELVNDGLRVYSTRTSGGLVIDLNSNALKTEK